MVHYRVSINDWDWSFSFSATRQRFAPDIYQDFRHLLIRGTLVLPKTVDVATVELTFVPNSKLNEGRKQSEMSGWVGFLQLNRKHLSGIISMPSDALSPVLQMLIAHRFRHIDLSGVRLSHGKANLRSYRFATTIDEE